MAGRNRLKCAMPADWQSNMMRLAGSVMIYQRPNTSRPAPAHKIYPFLLGEISIERVNQVWCAHIIYVPIAKGFL